MSVFKHINVFFYLHPTIPHSTLHYENNNGKTYPPVTFLRLKTTSQCAQLCCLLASCCKAQSPNKCLAISLIYSDLPKYFGTLLTPSSSWISIFSFYYSIPNHIHTVHNNIIFKKQNRKKYHPCYQSSTSFLISAKFIFFNSHTFFV